MDAFDRPPLAPLHAARIRDLYARHPTAEASALAWEIWRLQRVIVALDVGLRSAGGLRHRQDIIDSVAELRRLLAGEPCLNEPVAIKPGARRGERE